MAQEMRIGMGKTCTLCSVTDNPPHLFRAWSSTGMIGEEWILRVASSSAFGKPGTYARVARGRKVDDPFLLPLPSQ
jgi:hypothetical protein